MALDHLFTCGRCGAPAGVLTLYRPGEPAPAGDVLKDPVAWIVAETPIDEPRLAVRSGLGDAARFEFDLAPTVAALEAGDAGALFDVDREMVPFWCPTCPASYCAAEWETWDVVDEGFQELHGRCPEGHERLLLE